MSRGAPRLYYVYEGRTIRGLNLVGWALLTQTVVVIGVGVVLGAISLLYGAVLTNPASVFGPFIGVLLVLCGVEVAQLGVAILFLIGFFQVYSGRHEYGLEQARSLERALVFLIVYVVLSAALFVYSASSALIPGLTGTSSAPALLGSLVVSALAAFFAGLTLVHSIRSLADPAVKSRLRSALLLGVVGAALGPGLSLLASTVSPLTVDVVASGIIASALAGEGIAAISLFLFWWAYQDARRGLEAGTPAPVLPRIEQLFPWLYRPLYPYPPYIPPPPQTPRP